MLTRKHTVLVLMSIELMLAAVNINLVAFGAFHNTVDRPGVRAVRAHDRGGRGRRRLAIVLLIYRNLHSADLDDVDVLKG